MNKTNDVLELVVNSPYAKKYTKEIMIFLRNTTIRKFKEITNLIDFSWLFEDVSLDSIKEYLISKELEYNLIEQLMFKIKNNEIPMYNLLKIKNNSELLVLAKFNTLLELENKDNLICFDSENRISIDLISNLNSRHVSNLIKIFKEKNIDIDKDIVLGVIKLYCIFGYDNAYKIANDKFTYLTNSAIDRIADFRFVDERRAYRLDNQEEFYHHTIADEILEVIDIDQLIYNKLIKYTINNTIQEANELLNEIKLEISNNFEESKEDIIKRIIIDKINKREDEKKKQYHKDMHNLLNNKKREPLMAKELVYLLKDVSLNEINIDSKGQVIPNKDILSLILGNFKSDNDCLLRLILNEQALGLNNNLSQIINNYDKLKHVADNSNGKLSLNSILDLIDISKVSLYNMRPDECDITLDTFSKIIKSKDYCNETEEEIMKRSCKLHRKRKQKVYSSIPTVKGYCNEVYYEVAPFDAEYLLCSGIDTGSCLKVGGLGEDLLNYCLTNPHGIIVYLIDKNGDKYLCPVVRSGNGIHGNGIDPEVPFERQDALVDALKECFSKICEKTSKKNQKIEIATLTNLHMGDFMEKYPEYHLKVSLPLNEGVYNDYNKVDIKKHVLYKTKDFKDDEFYLSTDKYLQKRNAIFKYNIIDEIDQERIEILINAIAYAQIDFMPISEEEKKYLKRNYRNLDINDYIYIVGNKDWFIALKNDGKTLVNYILPYDNRAYDECRNSYEEMKRIFFLEGRNIKK